MKGILNLEWISCSYFNKKYLTASSPKVCGMFVYRPITSKCAITVYPLVFLSHLLRKSILSVGRFLHVLREVLIKCQSIH